MSELETAKKRAMYLLGGKDYSRRELYDKLKNNYSAETCEKVTALMCEYGYIDDRKYAKKLAHRYIRVSRYGKSRARLMMSQKGLDDETIAEALELYDSETIVGEIVSLIEKKYYDRVFLEGLEGRKEMQKVVAALARRGYGYGDIKSALVIVRDNYGEEAEE